MKIFFKILLAALFLGSLTSLNLPKNIEKKVSKEIKSYFEIEQYSKTLIPISKELNKKTSSEFNSNNLFLVTTSNKELGYLYVGKAPSKTDEFDYMVLFNKDFNIIKSKILIYREDYGNEIGSKRWLKQFVGKKTGDNLQYQQNIDAISGATISAQSMTIAVNNLLKDIGVLIENKAF